MRITLQSLLLFLTVLTAIWAYKINYETRSIERDISDLEKQIKFGLNKITLLEAEWAYLTSPKRLANMVDRNFLALKLVPKNEKHFIDSRTVFGSNFKASYD